ncbi:MAG: nucleotide exchange factor GrpE [Oscillospiraceae bacterium]|nr:nucleotide exchange factor GrpE [Oscillospiraceae bacterium]
MDNKQKDLDIENPDEIVNEVFDARADDTYEKADKADKKADKADKSDKKDKKADKTDKAELENSKAEIAKLKAEVETISDKHLRTLAEYDNYRKRTAKERLDLEPKVISKTVTAFLTIIDNLEHALNAETTDENYKEGVRLIYDNFKTALSGLGVTELPSEEFNPAYHQAVQQIDTEGDETKKSGHIAQVFQKGYAIGDAVLRFAMVSVYK